MEAIAAFSLACNVLQVLEFGYGLFQGVLYLAQPGEQSLPEHASASALATHLRSLTARVQATSLPSSVEPKLGDICHKCDEVALELIILLDSLKVTRKRLLVAKALRGQFKKKKIELLERRLGDYRSEIQLFITVDLSNRVDLQAAQQLDAYKALRTDSHYLSLTLLTAVKHGTNQLSDQIDSQAGLMQSLQLEASQKMQERTETLRQHFMSKSAQDRAQIISSIQHGISHSMSTTELEIANSTTRVLEANSLAQDTIHRSIVSTSQTMQEDIYKLNDNLQTLSLQFAQFDATLGKVVEHHNTARNQAERAQLQQEANRLTNTLVSLMELYRKFHELLVGLLDQARSFFGPLKFRELFEQPLGGSIESVALSDLSSTPGSRQIWSVSRFPRVQLPRISIADPGFYWINLRVSMMKPIKSTTAPQPGGHYRSQFTPPMSSPSKHSTPKYESVNTNGLTLFYRHCYQPFLPPSSRLLSIQRWRHREVRLANPLEECKKTIHRDKGRHDHGTAVIELARCGDGFVWFMALLVSALEECADSRRSTRIMRVVLSLVADWVCRIQATGDAETASLGVTASELGVASNPIARSFRKQTNNMVPIYAGRYDQKFLLGQKLAVDIAFWRKLAEASGLQSEVAEFVKNLLDKQPDDLTRLRSHSCTAAILEDDAKEELHDAQMAFLLVHTIMINRANMIGRIDIADSATIEPESVAFPITRIPGTVEWQYKIPRESSASILATVLFEFGLAGLNVEQKTPSNNGTAQVPLTSEETAEDENQTDEEPQISGSHKGTEEELKSTHRVITTQPGRDTTDEKWTAYNPSHTLEQT